MYRRSNPIIIKSVSSKYLPWIWVAVLVGVLINGCSELVIKEGDDGSAMIGKTMYRTVFAIGTLGYSEVKMREFTEEYEREQKFKAFEARVLEFLENGEITQAEADQLIQKKKARLWNDQERMARDFQAH